MQSIGYYVNKIKENPRSLLRHFITDSGLFKRVDDAKYLKWLWYTFYGTKLDISHPKTFN